MPNAIDHHPTSGEAICPYCGVGCRLWAEAAYGRVLRVKGVKDAPANLGGICAKGATLEQTIVTADRLVQPMIRKRRGTELQPVSWDAALDLTARRFTEIINQHGPDAVAFYGSGQLDSEAVYCVCKLFKGYLGTNNTDSNTGRSRRRHGRGVSHPRRRRLRRRSRDRPRDFSVRALR